MTSRALARMCVLLVAVLVTSCAGPQIHYPQLSALDKGMSRAQVVSRLALPPLSTHATTAQSRSFEFDRYRMNNGLHTDLYLLAYEGGRLVFWGYVSEFRRQPDSGLALALNDALRDMATRAP